MGPKKKQKSILDFSFLRPLSDQGVVDLTDQSDILCPVCSIAMDQMDYNSRIRHVEDCLSMLTIKEESQELFVGAGTSDTVETRVETNVVKVENIENKLESKLESSTGRKRKRKPELAAVQKEVVKYINSKGEKKVRVKSQPETTEDDQPTELLPSSRKTPIPPLKILTFRVTEGTEYEVSVDAFCYKPHELISQYFLSHFHSDHYGGITKRWCSERTLDSKIIYCSPITSRLLTLRFKVNPAFIYEIAADTRHLVHSYTDDIPQGGCLSASNTPGLYVTAIDANHCPGAIIFLFESVTLDGLSTYILHCGDFRINKAMINHPALQPFHQGKLKILEKVYLDTTYMSPKYNFPKQELVCEAVADMFEKLLTQDELFNKWFGTSIQSRITDFLSFSKSEKKKKFLVLVGTYLIGKERLAMAILKRLGRCPIFVSNINSRGDKTDIIRAFDDPYLNDVISSEDIGDDACDIMVHLVPMKIVGTAQEMTNYFNHNQYFRHFERCVGLRPTGWSFDGATNEQIVDAEDELPMVEDVSMLSTINVLRSHPEYSYMDILRQNRPKADRKMDRNTFKIYLLPYSEHLSFRELSFFVIFLNIGEVVPTVNTENAWSNNQMREIINMWEYFRLIKSKRESSLPEGLNNVIYELSLDDF